MTPLLEIPSGKLYMGQTMLDLPRSISLPRGVTAVVGPNGAGKSTFADIIERGRNFRTNRVVPTDENFSARKVEFSDIHSIRGIAATGYYQQRYEATMNDDVPTIGSIVDPRIDHALLAGQCSRLGLHDVMDKKINALSSGELRKLLVASALVSRPTLLILDNPYIGLDQSSRRVLDESLATLPADGVNVMLLVSDPRDIPDYADTVLPVADMTVKEPVDITAQDIESVRRGYKHMFGYAVDLDKIPRPLNPSDENFDVIARLEKVDVSYGSTTILNNIDWTIKPGECWALNGPNGAGKSTLLSLINADNPAGYRTGITLFDHRRGTGESIWDIKRLIGYVSPEMRLYFTGIGTALETVARGLNDTVGSYTKLRPDQIAYASLWLNLLHMDNIADRPFKTLSSGEKQLVLLLRALIKQPRLLILDEPMHGLDYGRKRSIRALINFMIAKSRANGRPMTLIYVTHDPYDMPECVNNIFQLPQNHAHQSPVSQ